jgi:hypothetical protein
MTRQIYGEDSLQALCLALRIAQAHLQGAVETGSRLLHADDPHESEFQLSNYFPTSLPEPNKH